MPNLSSTRDFPVKSGIKCKGVEVLKFDGLILSYTAWVRNVNSFFVQTGVDTNGGGVHLVLQSLPDQVAELVKFNLDMSVQLSVKDIFKDTVVPQ